MQKRFDYDVAVIGGGPAGYVAAIRAAQLGARTALIEKGPLGGVCTNVGCIPTKVLIHTARVMLQSELAPAIGLDLGQVGLNYPQLAKHRDDVVSKLRKGIESLLKSNKVELIREVASFEDDHTLSTRGEGGAVRLTAAKVMIATGAAAVELPNAPFDGKLVLDSSDAVLSNELPESIIIIGAGYIGCEFASAFAAFGVDLTLVELKERVLPEMDADCGAEVAKLLKKRGAKIFTSTGLEGLKKQEGGVKAVLSNGKEVSAQKALICVGRRPSHGGVALDKAGIKVGKKGEITVNANMQSSVPHVYAIGDVTGATMLAHVASRQALVAAAHAMGRLTARMDYRVVPACAFTFPEIATVGMTEEQARRQLDKVIVKKFPLRALGKAQIGAETEGFVKMIADGKTGQVLGVHIAAAEASGLIGEAALAIRMECTAEEIADTIHAHPTMPESIREAAEGVTGFPINWLG